MLLKPQHNHFSSTLHNQEHDAMRIGYARVSTIEQDNAMQIAALKAARCEIIVEEKRSAVKHRPELDKLLQTLKRGDQLIIYKLDRLARSLKHLLQIVEQLNDKGVRLKSVTEPIDADSAAGRMFLQMLGAFAEFERSLIRERCMAGQLEAVRQGKLIGRPCKLSLQEQNEVIELYSSGIPLRCVGEAYAISEATVRRLHGEATGRIPRQFGQVRQIHAAAHRPVYSGHSSNRETERSEARRGRPAGAE